MLSFAVLQWKGRTRKQRGVYIQLDQSGKSCCDWYNFSGCYLNAVEIQLLVELLVMYPSMNSACIYYIIHL